MIGTFWRDMTREKNHITAIVFYHFLSVTCENPKNLTNAGILHGPHNHFPVGTRVIFYCLRQTRIGPLDATCLSTGEWSVQLPYCGTSIYMFSSGLTVSYKFYDDF